MKSTILLLMLCCALLAQSRVADATAQLANFRDAVRLAPADARAHLLLGTALLDQSESSAIALFEALRELREAARLAPRDGEYAYQLGRAYQRVSEWSVARIKAVDPESARLYLILGESYSAQGNNERAVDAFQKAAARAPRMPGAHLALAFLYARQGQREPALQELDRELAISPGSAGAKAMKRQLDGGS